jgi:preprotein translocase subunit SecG
MFSFDLFAIFSGNIEEVRRILDVGQIKVDSSDEVGTLLPVFTAVLTTYFCIVFICMCA